MAAADMERNRSLKEALFESLSAILSPMHDVRAAGEEQIKALEVTEGLCRIDNPVTTPKSVLACRMFE